MERNSTELPERQMNTSSHRYIRFTLSNGRRIRVRLPSGQDYVIIQTDEGGRIKVFLDGRIESLSEVEAGAGSEPLGTGVVLPMPTDGRPQFDDSDIRGRIPCELQGGAVELGK